jgi:hypothetical protein
MKLALTQNVTKETFIPGMSTGVKCFLGLQIQVFYTEYN